MIGCQGCKSKAEILWAVCRPGAMMAGAARRGRGNVNRETGFDFAATQKWVVGAVVDPHATARAFRDVLLTPAD